MSDSGWHPDLENPYDEPLHLTYADLHEGLLDGPFEPYEEPEPLVRAAPGPGSSGCSPSPPRIAIPLWRIRPLGPRRGRCRDAAEVEGTFSEPFIWCPRCHASIDSLLRFRRLAETALAIHLTRRLGLLRGFRVANGLHPVDPDAVAAALEAGARRI